MLKNLATVLACGAVLLTPFAARPASYAETRQFTLTATSPASASTSTGTATTDTSFYSKCVFYAKLTQATGGALDVYIQSTVDGGTTWYDIVHYTQLAAGSSSFGYVAAVQRGGTGTAPVAVNTANGTPALAANTIAPFGLGNQLRTVFVAGASTSAGASQVILALCSTL